MSAEDAIREFLEWCAEKWSAKYDGPSYSSFSKVSRKKIKIKLLELLTKHGVPLEEKQECKHPRGFDKWTVKHNDGETKKMCPDCGAVKEKCNHSYEWGFSMQDGGRYEKCIHCGEEKP